MLPTIIIVALLVLYAVYAIQKTRKRVKNGCCGGGGNERQTIHIHPEDYQYHESFQIAGMHCDNCAARIEAVFQSDEHMAGIVDLKQNLLHIYSNQAIEKAYIAYRIETLGYRLIS